MTAEQKKKTGYTLAGVVAVLGAIGLGWGHIRPMLTWTVDNLGVVFARSQVQAVLVGLTAASGLGMLMPHVLPSQWPPARTRVVQGLACGVIGLALSWALEFHRIGFVYAVMTGIAAPTVAQLFGGALYMAFPRLKPESLQP